MYKLMISSFLLVAPVIICAAGAENEPQAAVQGEFHGKHIDSTQLKEWIDKKSPIVILDARSKPYYDGQVLPGAKWMSYDSAEATLKAAIPSKDSVVVVYCAGPGCPASGWLAARLEKLGYTNVYEYKDGINGWLNKGHPVHKPS